HYGVSFRWNPKFPINTLALMRGAIFAQRNGYLTRYSDAIFEAMWVDGEDMGDAKTISAALMKASLDAKQIMAATSEQPIKEALKKKTEEAGNKGGFGGPNLFGGGKKVFGQKPLAVVGTAPSEVSKK